VRFPLLAQIGSLVAPPACWACRGPLRRGGAALCAPCAGSLPWLGGSVCPRCALPSHCGRCPAAGAAWDTAFAPLAHEGAARALVAALKFQGAVGLAGQMAAHIALGAPRGLLEGRVLVPVPAHPRRRRSRGFDQAELLAGALGAARGLRVSHVLRRSGPVVRQVGASRQTRLRAAGFEVSAGSRVPLRVALVDDVHTTGATLAACAASLRDAGARSVVCVTYSRAVRRSQSSEWMAASAHSIASR
jgi:predicted amidophosphoribosyltransferase